MKKTRIISLILAVCIVSAAFVTGSVIMTGDNKTYMEFAKSSFNVVAPAGTDSSSLADNIYNTMLGMGVSVDRTDDSAVTDRSEILIGKCERAETKEALSILNSKGKGYDADYIIYEKNGNVAVVGNSDNATNQAVDRFVNLCLASGQIETGLIYTSLADSDNYTTISINGSNVDSSYCIVTPKYNMSYIVRLQLDKLTAAISEKAGYTLTENTDVTAPQFTQTYINRFSGKTWGNCETEADYQQYLSEYGALDKTKTTTEYTYEIVIGDCDRTGCPAITNEDEYTIKVSGNKIFLNGGSPASTAMAVSEFTKMVEAGDVTLTDASTASYDYYDALGSYDRSNYYTLAWADDFEGTAIDTNRWAVSYGRDSTIYSSGLNGRLPARASETLNNNYVQDGKLYIAAAYDDEYYYGGHLSTRNTMRMQYGYVETSCMKPFGQGFWTAMWVDNEGLNTNGLARMEIDVNESYGPGHVTLQNAITWPTTNGVNHMLNNYGISWISGSGFNKSNIRFNEDTRGFHLDFHTFGYAWDANELVFTVDGKETMRKPYATEAMAFGSMESSSSYPDVAIEDLRSAELDCTNNAFSAPAYIRLSMAVGFATRQHVVEDGAAEWTESNKYIIDYVHLYQLAGQKTYIYTTSNQRGDVNGDGNVDLADLTCMARYLEGWSKYDFKNLDLGAADVTGDGLVTSADLTKLTGYLVGDNTLS